MFSYIYLGTNDLERAIKFYDAAMGVLGLERCITGDADGSHLGRMGNLPE